MCVIGNSNFISFNFLKNEQIECNNYNNNNTKLIKNSFGLTSLTLYYIIIQRGFFLH